MPTTTAGTVIHPQAGENTQILGTYSVGPLTTQKRKESEEPWLLGSSQGITLGKSPALMSRVKCSHARGPRKSSFHVVESKELPPDLECCSSSERCKSLDCLRAEQGQRGHVNWQRGPRAAHRWRHPCQARQAERRLDSSPVGQP